jgi:hypothetical protein
MKIYTIIMLFVPDAAPGGQRGRAGFGPFSPPSSVELVRLGIVLGALAARDSKIAVEALRRGTFATGVDGEDPRAKAPRKSLGGPDRVRRGAGVAGAAAIWARATAPTATLMFKVQRLSLMPLGRSRL